MANKKKEKIARRERAIEARKAMVDWFLSSKTTGSVSCGVLADNIGLPTGVVAEAAHYFPKYFVWYRENSRTEICLHHDLLEG